MGFAVQLAGGANLVREPRCGRNFEYVSEDPLLTGLIAGAAIDGIQSQGVVSTLKHFALNAQETGRVIVSSDIGEAHLRESDLLAFEIALEQGRPRAVMTAYNRINGEQASEHEHLLSGVLKGDWGYTGFVMSDWGGTHSTGRRPWQASTGSQVASSTRSTTSVNPSRRLSVEERYRWRGWTTWSTGCSVRSSGSGSSTGPAPRPSTSTFTNRSPKPRLSKESSCLPTTAPFPWTRRRAWPSSAGTPTSAYSPAEGRPRWLRPGPSARRGERSRTSSGFPHLPPVLPLKALRAALPDAAISYLDGGDLSGAAGAASEADLAIVFVEQWTAGGHDVPDLGLPGRQDELVAAVARRTPARWSWWSPAEPS